MKLFLLISVFISSCVCHGQNFKKSEFETLYAKTINAIKNKDTLAFINLWQYPDSVANSCGDYVTSIFHNDGLSRHFAEISANWSPYIERLKFHDLYLEKNSKEEIDEWGQGFCYITTLDNNKNKRVYLCSTVTHFKGKLVYLGGSLLSPIKTE